MLDDIPKLYNLCFFIAVFSKYRGYPLYPQKNIHSNFEPRKLNLTKFTIHVINLTIHGVEFTSLLFSEF
jgi:hypothetical protein